MFHALVESTYVHGGCGGLFARMRLFAFFTRVDYFEYGRLENDRVFSLIGAYPYMMGVGYIYILYVYNTCTRVSTYYTRIADVYWNFTRTKSY